MSFSNPATDARETGAAYTRALLDLLGERDAVEVLEELIPSLHQLAAGLTPAQVASPERPGKWSIVEVAFHLADAELVFGFRMRMALAHEQPPLIGIDQDRWSERLRYRDGTLEDAVDQLGALRRAHLRLIRRLTDADLARVGLHAERGPESVGHMIRMMAGHDLAHRNQIARIRASFGH